MEKRVERRMQKWTDGLVCVVRRDQRPARCDTRRNSTGAMARLARKTGVLQAFATQTTALAALVLGAGCAPDLKQGKDDAAQGATAGNAGRSNKSSASTDKSSSAGGATSSQQKSGTATSSGGGMTSKAASTANVGTTNGGVANTGETTSTNGGSANSGGASSSDTSVAIVGGSENGGTSTKTQAITTGGSPSDTVTNTAVGGRPATGGTTIAGGAIGKGGAATGGTPIPDTTPPELKAKTPASTANPTDVVQATFSEPLNCSTVTSSTFQVKDTSSAVAGTLSCSGNTVTFTPRGGFVFTVNYTVSLTSGIKDVAGNGLKDAPQSWSFKGREGKWDSSSVVLDSTAAGRTPEVAVSLNGDAMVIWSRANGLADNAWSCRYAQSSGKWSGATPVFTHAEDSFSALRVAGDDSGNFTAAWAQGVRGFTDMWDAMVSRIAPGDVWETPTVLSTDTTTTSTMDMHLTVHPNGDASLVWLQHGHAFSAIGEKGPPWGSRFSANTKAWSTATKLRSENCVDICAAGSQDGTVMTLCSTEDVLLPITWKPGQSPSADSGISNRLWKAIRSYGGGNFVTLWSDGSAPLSLYSNRWSSSTSSWGTDAKVVSQVGSLWSNPVLAVNERGAAVALWLVTVNGIGGDILMGAHVAGASTSWNWITELSPSTAASSQSPSSPSVAIDAAGTAVAAWTQSDANGVSVWVSQFVATAASPSWSAPIRLSQNNAGYAKVAVHPSGKALVVWEENESASSENPIIRARWFR